VLQTFPGPESRSPGAWRIAKGTGNFRAWELADPISTPGFLFGWRLEKLLLGTARGLRILVPVIPSAAKPTGCRLRSADVPLDRFTAQFEC
jgi:hypothetical protein